MKSNLPLTLEEVLNEICDKEKGLAMRLWKLIGHRNDAVNQLDIHYMEALTDDVKIVRTRQEIVDVVRRYNLKCKRCEKEFILGFWRMFKNEAILLECPGCKQCTPLLKYKDLEDLLAIAPAPLEDLFAQEK